jgi:hypothetical protein
MPEAEEETRQQIASKVNPPPQENEAESSILGTKDKISERGFGALMPMDEDDEEEERLEEKEDLTVLKNAEELRLDMEQRPIDPKELSEGERKWRE